MSKHSAEKTSAEREKIYVGQKGIQETINELTFQQRRCLSPINFLDLSGKAVDYDPKEGSSTSAKEDDLVTLSFEGLRFTKKKDPIKA